MKNFSIKILITFFLTLFSCSPLLSIEGSKRVVIKLIDDIAVTAPEILLHEIAEIETADESLKEDLKTVSLGKVPAIGLSDNISARDVERELNKLGVEDVEVLGIQSSVYTLSKKIDRDQIKEIISNWVSDNTDAGIDPEISYLRVPAKWKVPLGSDVSIEVNSRGRKPEGTLNVKIESRVGESILSQARVKIAVKKMASALVASRPIANGEMLDKHNLEVRKVDVTGLNGMELSDYDMVQDKLSRRSLPIGEVLRVQDIEEPILVRSGTLNQIIVKNGAIKMRIAGAKALQNGKKGEVIMFSNPLNKDEKLQAQVIKEGLAVLKLR